MLEPKCTSKLPNYTSNVFPNRSRMCIWRAAPMWSMLGLRVLTCCLCACVFRSLSHQRHINFDRCKQQHACARCVYVCECTQTSSQSAVSFNPLTLRSSSSLSYACGLVLIFEPAATVIRTRLQDMFFFQCMWVCWNSRICRFSVAHRL